MPNDPRSDWKGVFTLTSCIIASWFLLGAYVLSGFCILFGGRLPTNPMTTIVGSKIEILPCSSSGSVISPAPSAKSAKKVASQGIGVLNKHPATTQSVKSSMKNETCLTSWSSSCVCVTNCVSK